jgi:hypothetical protein
LKNFVNPVKSEDWNGGMLEYWTDVNPESCKSC